MLTGCQILTTAMFTVTMLGRSLGPKKWVSLILLTIGVSIVSIPSSTSNENSLMVHDMTDHFFPRSVHELGQAAEGVAEAASHLTRRAMDGMAEVGETLMKRSASYEGIHEDQNLAPIMNYSIGVSAALATAAISGLTGVYFEKVLKDPTSSVVSVWTRNIQLSFYSLFPALFFGVILKDGEDIAKHGFFEGYNWVVWVLILLQAFGGILVSLCISYADNIAKNFATSISIIISFMFSLWFFKFPVSVTVGSEQRIHPMNLSWLTCFKFLIGTGLVMVATFLYSGPERKRSKPPPINIHNYEKTTIDPLNTPRTGDLLAVPNPLEAVKHMGLSTSRPASPLRSTSRAGSARSMKHRDE